MTKKIVLTENNRWVRINVTFDNNTQLNFTASMSGERIVFTPGNDQDARRLLIHFQKLYENNSPSAIFALLKSAAENASTIKEYVDNFLKQ